MGLISSILAVLFGGGRNVIAETAEVFVENKEAGAQRQVGLQAEVLRQFAAEFGDRRRGWFDRMIDGLNRLPRPALALGTLTFFGIAMYDPVWFAMRMQGLILVPEPLWWLMGAIVSFYFGARHQVKTQEFQKSIAASIARTAEVKDNIEMLETLRADSPGAARVETDPDLSRSAIVQSENPALDEWRQLTQRTTTPAA